jgi:hypothetical protein
MTQSRFSVYPSLIHIQAAIGLEVPKDLAVGAVLVVELDPDLQGVAMGAPLVGASLISHR